MRGKGKLWELHEQKKAGSSFPAYMVRFEECTTRSELLYLPRLLMQARLFFQILNNTADQFFLAFYSFSSETGSSQTCLHTIRRTLEHTKPWMYRLVYGHTLDNTTLYVNIIWPWTNEKQKLSYAAQGRSSYYNNCGWLIVFVIRLPRQCKDKLMFHHSQLYLQTGLGEHVSAFWVKRVTFSVYGLKYAYTSTSPQSTRYSNNQR